jgi:outer membrane protein assembly factor BamB
MTVSNMRLRWKFFAGKDITATPAVADGVVYFPSWNGYLYAVNAFNGTLRWRQNLGDLTGLNGTGIVVNVTVSRSTPIVYGNLLLVGIYGTAVVIAVDRSNGRLLWSTQLDPRPRVLITMSGTACMGLVKHSNIYLYIYTL